MSASTRVRAALSGASLLVLALALAGPASAQTLTQQVRQLTGELKTLREQIDGLGRQVEERAQEGVASRREVEQSFRDWFAESIRRTERMEELSVAGQRQQAVATATAEATLKAAIDHLSQRVERLQKDMGTLPDAAVVARLDAARAEIDGRMQRLEELAARPPAPAPTVEDGGALAAGLERRIDGVAEDVAARLAAQDAALARLAATVERLEREEVARADQVATTTDAVRALLDRARTELAARIDGIDRQSTERDAAQEAATAALRTTLAETATAMAERIERVERDTASIAQQRSLVGEARLERLLGAAVHLSAITQTARPFARELAYVRQIGEGVRGIEGPVNELLVHAARGAPTIMDLRQSFDGLAPAVIARAGARDEGWTGTARRWATEAGSRFGVVDPPPPTAARSAVLAAEVHLARGQLAQAVAALTPLDPAALSQAATWIIHARSRISIDQAATELVNRVMAQVLTR
ncbi:hypothetical protein STHU_03470 [Allostella humosa]|nr:hypothetical protein [Stella humosa]BBK29713.1 hypothetical protein STHU_03470 [Stella humosa]